ncbi:hypothetical protein FB45DRAFT_1066847 [Roridomyces roridus]|uniref:Uncharacterized protein n=1 Tax=Roridomyces roridus TaxID=1738132 RepID=A0AAD7B3G3_9AGAR|nr:hypothetical protein FB45DRAFT_1066847 [Roridomyces roridus]
MSAYWTAHPDFNHNPALPLRQQFGALAALRGWRKRSKVYNREWEKCGREEFTFQFGSDENRLAGWQAMCALVGVNENDVPASITRCKQLLRRHWVNIYDLLDAQRSGTIAKTHPSCGALQHYTISKHKIFPLKSAKGNRFLKVLLIDMFV